MDVTILIAKDKPYHHDVEFTKRGWEFKATTGSGDTENAGRFSRGFLYPRFLEVLSLSPYLNATL